MFMHQQTTYSPRLPFRDIPIMLPMKRDKIIYSCKSFLYAISVLMR
nr:MAG TPA: hypothetical protein [Caudoviricetes sp.]